MIDGDEKFEVDYRTASAVSSMLASGLVAFVISKVLPDEAKYLALLPAAAVYLWMIKSYGDKV